MCAVADIKIYDVIHITIDLEMFSAEDLGDIAIVK